MGHKAFADRSLLGAPAARLEADAIGVAQDTVIGMASSAPAGTMAAVLASLALTSAYSGGLIILLTAVPMLIIANAYRRLNMWNANCGASFEWVGRAINPYLGFLTGWTMIAGYLIGTVAEVVVLGPSVLAIFGYNSSSPSLSAGIDTVVILVMGLIAIAGIKTTAWAQVLMAIIEYSILGGIAALGLMNVLFRQPGTYDMTGGWWNLHGVGGHGSLIGSLLITLYLYSLYDGGIYVNEEVRHRRINPGRATVWAVALLAVLYSLAQIGLQGVVGPARLQAHASTALIYVAYVLGGTGLAKAMALAIALSVVATTGTGIVLTTRIVYGMASRHVLPEPLSRVSTRYKTPAVTSAVIIALLITLTWVYLEAGSFRGVLSNVVAVAGLLATMFYIMTALATTVYYRRKALSGIRDFFTLGSFPGAAIVFLSYVMWKYLSQSPAGQSWTIIAVIASGIAAMLIARFRWRSGFFKAPLESYRPGTENGGA
jgi:amino acid transporter